MPKGNGLFDQKLQLKIVKILLFFIRISKYFNIANTIGCFFSPDVDECGSSDMCDSVNGICTNTVPNYMCSCVDGYQLSSDQRSCVGKLTINALHAEADDRSKSSKNFQNCQNN